MGYGVAQQSIRVTTPSKSKHPIQVWRNLHVTQTRPKWEDKDMHANLVFIPSEWAEMQLLETDTRNLFKIDEDK